MSKPLSHRERSERALKALYKTGWVPKEAFPVPGPVDNIARETFPAELLEAVKLRMCSATGHHYQCPVAEFGMREEHCNCQNLRTALAIYEEEPDQ